MMLLSFGLCLLLFVAIGLLSSLRREQTGADYLLASQSVKPWLVALSAIATNNSGYMFIGMIGFTYTYGLSSIWLMVGWIAGDFLASLVVHQRLRESCGANGEESFAGALANWHGGNFQALRVAGGVMTVVFLGTYAAAQLNAGSKALHVLFGWEYGVGAAIGAAIVLAYCVAGGIRASIWTDAAQSVVMICAMSLMLWTAIEKIGGWSAFGPALDAVSPTYMDWFPPDLAYGGWFGPALFVTGWLFAGAAVIGQPHIMVRFMAMDDPDRMWRVRTYYYGWFTAFYALTIVVGLASRLLLPEVGTFDAELALPTLAGQLLPPAATGLVLAGLFAATISTADSQILSCTAAITRDFPIPALRGYVATKLATVFVTTLALSIALGRNESVFSLVLIAWSALAAAFGPLMIVYSLDKRPTQGLALTMMAAGVAVVLMWRWLGWDETVVYEVMPGMLSGLAVYWGGEALGFAESGREMGALEAEAD
ncbi:MAG: sodium/proline symporter [Acidobacteria bacterium]|nr:sodium/proline symporter [Acidobacteriota bacterium]